MNRDNRKNSDEKPIPKSPLRIISGKDKLNFAEFPLGVLSTRAPEGQKLLSFKREAIDKDTGKPVTRELRITAPPDASLPTATDDEVVLALLQHSKTQRFQSRKVYFTRYQILNILKWNLNGQSYRRLSESLDRLARVDYRYLNAWFDKSDNRWKNATFQILDTVVIDPKETETSRPKPVPNQPLFEFASSWFTWSEIVYGSLQVGFMKTLNYDFATSLKSKTALRLFRFLDKRFWHKSKLEFDLAQLGYEHIGISRNSPLKQVKREIKVATRELENKGYLTPILEEKRFLKIKIGEWKVTFVQASPFRKTARDNRKTSSGSPELEDGTVESEKNPNMIQVCNELIRRGITDRQASKLTKKYERKILVEKMNQFDFLMESGKTPKNPPGYLFSSITDENWQEPPMGYKNASERKSEEDRKREKAEEIPKKQEQNRIRNFWDSLSPEERKQSEEEALDQADRTQVQNT
jgi:hypothetical protein